MPNTSKLRVLNTSPVLSKDELELLNWNFWAIENALNSVGAVTPLPQGTVPPPPSAFDATKFYFLPGLAGGQDLLDATPTANDAIFTIRPNYAYNSAHTKVKFIDNGNFVYIQFGSDATNGLITSGSAPAITIGRADGSTRPLIISNDALVGSNSAVCPFVKGTAALSYTQAAISGHSESGQVNIYLGIDGALNTTHRGLSLYRAPGYSPTNFSLGLRTNIASGFSGSLVLDCNGGSGNLITSAQVYLLTTNPMGFSYTQQGIWDFIHTTGNNATPMMIFAAKSGQTADFYRWQLNAGTVMSKLDIAGNLTATSFIGNIATLTTRGDLLTRDAANSIRLAVGGNKTYLRSNGTDPAWSSILDADLSGNIAKFNTSGSVTNVWDFGSLCGFSGDYSAPDNIFYAFDTSTSNSMVFQFDLPLSSPGTIIIPSAGGTLLTTVNTVSVSNKAFTVTNNSLRCSTAASGVAWADNTTPTKVLRLRVANLTAAAACLLAFRGSAARIWEFPNVDITVTGKVGNTEGGTLSDVDLTGQTASIGSTALVTAPAAGTYRVSIYAATTTAGNGGDIVTVTIGWNDGVARTFVTANLDLSTTAAQPITINIPIKVASGNITYLTTVTKTGTPQYLLTLRCEAN